MPKAEFEYTGDEAARPGTRARQGDAYKDDKPQCLIALKTFSFGFGAMDHPICKTFAPGGFADKLYNHFKE